MSRKNALRVAILYSTGRDARASAPPEKLRYPELSAALAAYGVGSEALGYHDEWADRVRRQLLQVDGVLVWVNPLEGGRDRSALDALLREVAARGIVVSTHPDIILKLGTKEVLYRTRDLGWGCDTHLYASLEQMRQELPERLAAGRARVLKQYRGNGGDGVWKVELPVADLPASKRPTSATPQAESLVWVRHAKRGSFEEQITLREFFERCARYFVGDGRMIDQEYQERLPEGMVRCYLVQDRVAGFGHQAVNALFPAPAGEGGAAPEPGPRLYHPPSLAGFQPLKHQLEDEWVPALQRLLRIDTDNLPLLWDCDFLLGPRNEEGVDTYVLCEINVSSVAPYPQSAVSQICEATVARLQARHRG